MVFIGRGIEMGFQGLSGICPGTMKIVAGQVLVPAEGISCEVEHG